MEDPNDASSSHTETSAEERLSGSTSSKDTKDPDKLAMVGAFKTEAIEVNSADEVRQAIKAVLSGKTPMIQSEIIDPVQLANNKPTEEIQISLSHEYKPESGDQLLVPKQDKPRKRRGRPQKAGPSKRAKKTDEFYVGKLANVVSLLKYKDQKPRSNNKAVSADTQHATNQWLRMWFYK